MSSKFAKYVVLTVLNRINLSLFANVKIMNRNMVYVASLTFIQDNVFGENDTQTVPHFINYFTMVY